MQNTKTWVLVVFFACVAVLSIAFGAHFAQTMRARDLSDTLQPIASLLEENRKILSSLKADDPAVPESMLLEAYLANIRKEGLPKYAAVKQRIDMLVDNNTVIVALSDRYVLRARGADFKVTAEEFRHYATDLRGRWQSVFAIFMAGGNLPAAGAGMPTAFVNTVATEIASLK
jgi:hypothetical protein